MLTQAGCGTLLYPERQGQSGVNVDPTILILNGIGLLFFVVPGLVAFAVDFSNGTIYLPAESGSLQLSNGLDVKGDIDETLINAVIEKELKVSNVLKHPELEVSRAM